MWLFWHTPACWQAHAAGIIHFLTFASLYHAAGSLIRAPRPAPTTAQHLVLLLPERDWCCMMAMLLPAVLAKLYAYRCCACAFYCRTSVWEGGIGQESADPVQ